MSPRKVVHHHPCQQCGAKTPCDGTWEANHDGWPAAVCAVFHLEGGARNPRFVCEDCAETLRLLSPESPAA